MSNELRERIKKHMPEIRSYHVTNIGIFGSYARGDQKEGSDLDILIETDNTIISFLDLVKIENYLSDILKCKVDLVAKDDLRSELRAKILKEVIYV